MVNLSLGQVNTIVTLLFTTTLILDYKLNKYFTERVTGCWIAPVIGHVGLGMSSDDLGNRLAGTTVPKCLQRGQRLRHGR